MKKFLAIAVIAASMVACGNKGDKKVDETKMSDTTKVITTDTATVVKDSTVKTTVVTDTLKKN